MTGPGSPATGAVKMVVLAAVAYFIAARIGYALFVPGGTIPLWPPAGITLGLLLLTQKRDWSAILIGALLASIASDLLQRYPVPFTMAASVANVGESLAAAWLIRRYLPAPVQLTTVRAVIIFVLAGPLLANSITSIAGSLALSLSFTASFWRQYFIWWIGDGLGMLIVAPLVLAWGTRRAWTRVRATVWLELSALLVATFIAAHYGVGTGTNTHLVSAYLVFPMLFWAALRFGFRGGATVTCLVAIIAMYAATRGAGAFVTDNVGQMYVPFFLYLYLGIVVISALVPAAVVEERWESARQLAISEERYRSVAESATDVIVTINEESRIQYVNPAAQDVFGYQPDALVGRSLAELMPEDRREAHHAGMQRYLETGVRRLSWRAANLTGLHRDGRPIPLEISFGESVTQGRREFTGIIRDVSHKRALEARYAQSQRLEALGQLAGGVAHDFNNLLTAIKGYGSMLRDGLDPKSEGHEDATELLNAADRADALTKQLVAFSRKQPIAPRLMDLGDLVSRMGPILRRLLTDRIEFRVDAAPGYAVVADPGQMEQVLLNLVVNARDAMPDGGSIAVELGGDRMPAASDNAAAGRAVLLTVRDTGAGIPADVLPRIFEPFFTTKESKGTGLGLATVYGVVAHHGGVIDVASEVGRGTTFRIWIPAAS